MLASAKVGIFTNHNRREGIPARQRQIIWSIMKTLITFLVFSVILSCTVKAAEEKNGSKSEPKKQSKTQTQTQPQTVPVVTYEIMLQGTYSGMKEPLAKIITNTKEWEDLWKKHVSVLVPQPPLPEVDFDSYVLAAIFTGEKRTSGYQIVVNEIVPEGNNVIVRYRETEPPANSFTLQVLTQPHIILKIEKPKGTVQLIKQ